MTASGSSSQELVPGITDHLPSRQPPSHVWFGVAGRSPAQVVTARVLAGLPLLGAIGLQLKWWAILAAIFVLAAANFAITFWQAGQHRVVAVTGTGIHVLERARWAGEATRRLGTMPRMPLGPLSGRWSRVSIAGEVMWIHRRDHAMVKKFDDDYRSSLKKLPY